MTAVCSSQRSKRKFLSTEEKKKVIEEVRLGKLPVDIVSEYGIGKTQVYKLYKSRDAIDKSTVPKLSKILAKKCKYPDIDSAVFEWLCALRKMTGNRRPLPVSRELVQARALHEARVRNITDFKASDGWFNRWRWRYNIENSVRLCGEAGDVNVEDATKEIEKLKHLISSQSYEVENIFNMDETGVFYKSIPSRTYLMPGECKKTARGTKQMKAKDRLTVILCANATGTFKISPVVIGTAKRPRCFVRNPPQLPYFSQKSAWDDTKTFERWWHEIFLKEVRVWTSSPVALLLDGFSGHDRDCNDPLGQVRIFTFPPNITSIFQPLDQGIILTFKTKYKSKLLEHLVSVAPGYENLQSLAEQLPSGCAGLQYGKAPHVSDAMALMKSSWESIKPAVIEACWRRANCLPAKNMVTNPADDHLDAMDKLEEETLHHMRDLLSKLSMSYPSTGVMLNGTGLDVVAKAVQSEAVDMLTTWLHLEEEREVMDVEDGDDADSENEFSPRVQIEGLEKVSVLRTMLPHLYSVHAAGIKLNDSTIANTTRELCMHVVKEALQNEAMPPSLALMDTPGVSG
jgi:hypothetical protein